MALRAVITPAEGGIGGFVGVELHILLILGLLTRGVRRKIFQCTAEKRWT